jgi:hypothetical protein
MNQPADQKQQQQPEPQSRYMEYQDSVAQRSAEAVRTSQRSDQQARLANVGWHTEEQEGAE